MIHEQPELQWSSTPINHSKHFANKVRQKCRFGPFVGTPVRFDLRYVYGIPKSDIGGKYTRLEDVLVFPVVAERVLAPAGRPAPLSGEVGKRVRQTGRTDVRVSRKVHRRVHAEHGHVVVQRAGVELPVDDQGHHVLLHVRVELHVVVHVPFAQADAQVLFVVPAVAAKTE